eukprot:11767761-Prorocentrum_lima.AAC.1
MITAGREAAALSALPHLCHRIKKVLLRPREGEEQKVAGESQGGVALDALEPPPGVSRAQWEALSRKFNQAQLQAVAAVAQPS